MAFLLDGVVVVGAARPDRVQPSMKQMASTPSRCRSARSSASSSAVRPMGRSAAQTSVGTLRALLIGCAECDADGGGVEPTVMVSSWRVSSERRVDCTTDALLDGLRRFAAMASAAPPSNSSAATPTATPTAPPTPPLSPLTASAPSVTLGREGGAGSGVALGGGVGVAVLGWFGAVPACGGDSGAVDGAASAGPLPISAPLPSPLSPLPSLLSPLAISIDPDASS